VRADEFIYLKSHHIARTLWSWPEQNPLRWRDPSGHDVWVEGLSPGESQGHLSIVVGDPSAHNNAAFTYGAAESNAQLECSHLRLLVVTALRDSGAMCVAF
jgi:hypothetical protein